MSEYNYSIITENVIVERSIFCTQQNFARRVQRRGSWYVQKTPSAEIRAAWMQTTRPRTFVAPSSIELFIISIR